MINKKWSKMNDIFGTTIDLDSIDGYYTNTLEHPRIYVYVKGAKIILNYRCMEEFEYDLNKIKYGLIY